jgi:hypothetical protein
MKLEDLARRSMSRRSVLKVGAAGFLASQVALFEQLAWVPNRVAMAASAALPDIQFDIGSFIAPVQTVAGVQVHFGPVYTHFTTAKLTRTPQLSDQKVLAGALDTIEASYPFSPSGVFVFTAYGLPYFNRLPHGLSVSRIPGLASDKQRSALQEAVPSPTDVSPLNPQVTKTTFNVPVTIETNDLLFTLRSDLLSNIADVVGWLKGSGRLNGKAVPSPAFDGLLQFTGDRFNFVQPGLPRQVADANNLPFAFEINPTSSMWMGFVDQQVHGSAPTGATVTFAGSSTAHLTTASQGDYFDNGAIQHLSHDINDLAAFYSDTAADSEPFSERIQYMFRSKTNAGVPGLPFPQDPNDFFTNGGGLGAPTGGTAQQQQSAFIENVFLGTNDMATNFDPAVTDHHKYRVGHVSGLQRSSRAADGTPLHIRNDGPGFNSLDVPDGSTQPTLEFTVFVPTADFFSTMRVNAASLDYVKADGAGGTATSVPAGDEAADDNDDGLERFLTATRRQNFLTPPRRHRAFPLLELEG